LCDLFLHKGLLPGTFEFTETLRVLNKNQIEQIYMKKVLGMGNALVDVITRLENENLLNKLRFPKGSMQLVDKTLSDRIMRQTSSCEKILASGGSAANTIHGLANMGIQTGFIGSVGDDELGIFFREDMLSQNINPILFTGKSETGKAIALITPDTERTFTTYLGASIELNPNHLTVEYFNNYDYFYIEGYLVQDHDLIKKAVKLAKENGLVVSLDLASFNVVEENREFLKSIIVSYVDIVFANEGEARSYTEKDPNEALAAISDQCQIAVLKTGNKGSLVKSGNEFFKIEPIPVNSVDTTGAGDLYAAGFLYALINGMSLDKCGYIGSILSGKVIEVIGSKMDKKKWVEVKQMVDKVNS
jgi:sugar/nucleoside kinase (ribokinase family)